MKSLIKFLKDPINRNYSIWFLTVIPLIFIGIKIDVPLLWILIAIYSIGYYGYITWLSNKKDGY